MNTNVITVSAPGKLMLFGEHAVIYGRPCIVTAVDTRVTVTVEKVPSQSLIISAPDVGIVDYVKVVSKLGQGGIPNGVKFVEFAVKNFKSKYKLLSGLKITTKSGFSSKFGFGSSSAITVAVLKAISELFRVKVSKNELFDLAYKTVLDVQGVGSGFDLAAAIWGGTIYFVSGGKKVVPLKVGDLPLVVGYTGVKADTATLVLKVADLYKKNNKVLGRIFEAIESIVVLAKNAIIQKDYKKLGELMNLNEGLLDSLGVSTIVLSDLIFASRKSGAYGAKLSGAGGGDCMIALADAKHGNKVKMAIKAAGGTILDIKTGAEGVRIEQ